MHLAIMSKWCSYDTVFNTAAVEIFACLLAIDAEP